MNAIKVQALTKSYGKARGIDNLTFEVKKGDIFGFIGPNGAGKSTTIRTLLGFIKKTSGSAKIFNLDIENDHQKIMELVGYVPSEAVFYDSSTVAETIALSAQLRGKNLSKRAAGLCEYFELDPTRKIKDLSFGNRKKVSLACALQHNPRLIILDEPTSGLDPLMQQKFWQLLERRRAKGATIFLSSHVLSEVQQYCNRAAIIRQGRLVAVDEIANLAQANTHKISLRGIRETDWRLIHKDFKANIKNLDGKKGDFTFLYDGPLPKIVAAIAWAKYTDLTIVEPDLEEIFMHYYTDDNQEPQNA